MIVLITHVKSCKYSVAFLWTSKLPENDDEGGPESQI